MKKILPVLGVAAVLGASMIPLSSYAATTTGAKTVTVVVGSTLDLSFQDLSTSGGISIDANGYVDSSDTSNRVLHYLTASSNNSGGYHVTIEDDDADTFLSNGAGAQINSVSADNTQLAGGSNGWGWQVAASASASGSNSWNKIPARNSGTNVKEVTAQTAAQTDNIYVRFGVATDADQASGTYTDDIVYTIVAN